MFFFSQLNFPSLSNPFLIDEISILVSKLCVYFNPYDTNQDTKGKGGRIYFLLVNNF